MEPEPSRQSAVPITSLILVAAAVTGLALYEQPLESDRHTIRPEAYAFESPGIEKVYARLWQDPLLSVMVRRDQDTTEEDDASKDVSSLDELRADVRSRLDAEEPERANVLLMPLLVSGHAGPEAIEDRRRQRLALVSALGSRGFTPEDPHHVGYLEVSWDSNGCMLRDDGGRVPVPFEWFVATSPDDMPGVGDAPAYVLVLHLAEEALVPPRSASTRGPRKPERGNPLTAIDELARRLVEPDEQDGEFDQQKGPSGVRLAVIGPASSSTLERMTHRQADCAIGDDRSLVDVLHKYLDDGIPGDRDALAAHLAPYADPLEGLDPSSQAFREKALVLVNAMRAALPGVQDSDRFWSRNVIADWLGIEQSYVPSSPEGLARLLVDGTATYLDDGLPPELDRDGVAADLAPEIHRELTGGVSTPPDVYRGRMAGLLRRSLPGTTDSEIQWAERVVDIWYPMAFPADSASTGEPRADRSYETLAGEYVAYLHDYLDDGLPTWVDRLAIETELRELLLDEADNAFRTAHQNDDEELLRQARTRLEKSLEDQRLSAGGNQIEDGNAMWLDFTLRSFFEFIRDRVATHVAHPSLLPDALIVSGRATRASFGPRPVDPEECRLATLDPEFPPFQRVAARIEEVTRRENDGRGARLLSITPSDLELSRELSRELVERGVDPEREKFVVISESDSVYGRALPATMDCALRSVAGENLVGRVHEFTYLSGIDGVVPRVNVFRPKTSTTRFESDKSSPNADSGKSREPRTAAPGGAFDLLARAALGNDEPAVGTKRFDAMRRLVRSVRALEDRPGTIGAVAVLGSDAYDKEIILQALRAELRNALFVTTDLDARFLEPSAMPWSRNLIVSSGFGLALHPTHQQGFPPFRDSYQTSTFVSVGVALDKWYVDRAGTLAQIDRDEVDARRAFVRAAVSPRPRLFEIGRGSYALDITRDYSEERWPAPVAVFSTDEAEPHAASQNTAMAVPASAVFPDDSDDALAAVPAAGPPDAPDDPPPVSAAGAQLGSAGSAHPPLHPVPPTAHVEWLTLASLGAVLLVLLLTIRPLASPIHAYLFERSDWTPTERWQSHLLVALAALLFVAFGLALRGDPRGEPFAWWLGVSAWPTEIILAVTLILCFGLWISMVSRIDRSTAQLSGRFGLPSTAAATEAAPGLLAAVRATSVVSWLRQARESTDETRSVEQLWRDYLGRGTPVRRSIRIATTFVFVTALVLMLTEPWPLHDPPLRGASARFAHFILFYGSILAITLLTLAVVDASRLCRAFVGWFAEVDSHWEDVGTRGGELAERFGLKAEDADEVVGPLMTIELIARRTDHVGHVLTYPFVVGALFCLSQLRVFDAWSWSEPIIALLGLLAVFALVPAFTVRTAAEGARTRALGALRQVESKILAAGDYSDEAERRAAQVKLVAEAVSATRFGAFAPWRRHALLAAVLIPFGGLGVVALLEVAAVMGF